MAFSKLDALASVAELIGGHDETGRCDARTRATRRRVPARCSNGEAGGFSIHERSSASEYGIEATAKEGCTSPQLDSSNVNLMDTVPNSSPAVPPARKMMPLRVVMERVGIDSVLLRDHAVYSEPGAGLQQHISSSLKRSSPFDGSAAKDGEDTWAFPPAKRRNAISAGGAAVFQQGDVANSAAAFGLAAADESADHFVRPGDDKPQPPQHQQQARHPAPPRWSSSLGNVMAHILPSGAASQRGRASSGRPSPGVSGASDEPCNSSHYTAYNTSAFVGWSRTSAGSHAMTPYHHLEKIPQSTQHEPAAAAARLPHAMAATPAALTVAGASEEPAPETRFSASDGLPPQRRVGGAVASSSPPKTAGGAGDGAAAAAAAAGTGAAAVDSDPAACLSMMAQSPSKGGPDLLEKMRIAETLLTHRDKLSPRMVQLVIQQLAVLCQSASVDDLVTKLAAERDTSKADGSSPAGDSGATDVAAADAGPGTSLSNSGSHTRGEVNPEATTTTAPCGPGPVATPAAAAAAGMGPPRSGIAADATVGGEGDGLWPVGTGAEEPSRRPFKPWRASAQVAAGAAATGAISPVTAAAVDPADELATGSTSSSSSSSRTAAKGAQPRVTRTESTLTGPRSNPQAEASGGALSGDRVMAFGGPHQQSCPNGLPVRPRERGPAMTGTAGTPPDATRGGRPAAAAAAAAAAARHSWQLPARSQLHGYRRMDQMYDDMVQEDHAVPAPAGERIGGVVDWDLVAAPRSYDYDAGAANAPPPPRRRALGGVKRPAGGQSGGECDLPLAGQLPAVAQQQLELEAEVVRPGEPARGLEPVLDLTTGSSVTTAALIAALAQRARSIAGMRPGDLDSIAAALAQYKVGGAAAAVPPVASAAPARFAAGAAALQQPPVILRRRQLHTGGDEAMEVEYGGASDWERSAAAPGERRGVGRHHESAVAMDEMAESESGAMAEQRRLLQQLLLVQQQPQHHQQQQQQHALHSSSGAIPKSTVALARRAFAAAKAAAAAASGNDCTWADGDANANDASPAARLQRIMVPAAGTPAPPARLGGRGREGPGPMSAWSAVAAAAAAATTGRGLDLHRCSAGSGGVPLSPDGYVTIRLPVSRQVEPAAGKAAAPATYSLI